MIYLAIIRVEKKRRYPARSRIFINYRKLSEKSGVSIPSIKKSLEILQEEKLIKFKSGRKREKGLKRRATEIQRTIPIPRRRHM